MMMQLKYITTPIDLIPDHPYRVLINDGSRSGKTNVLLRLMKHQQPDVDKIYLYVKIYLLLNMYATKTARKKLFWG